MRAHLKKDNNRYRLISCIYLFYMASLGMLFAFETFTRYIQVMYYMLTFSNLGGLLMFRALQKSIQKHQSDISLMLQRRLYAILIVSYTFTILNGINQVRNFGPRCSPEIVYPFSFMVLMFQ